MILGLLIAGGVVVFLAFMAFVFNAALRAQRERVAKARHALESESIELESGAVAASAEYRDFHSHGLYASYAVRTMSCHLVLTGKQLAILGGRPWFAAPRGELHRWQVGLDGTRLRLVADDPPGAKGHVDLRLSVPEAERWVITLRAAGCSPLSAA